MSRRGVFVLRLSALGVVLAGALAAASCASVLPKSAESQFFVLSAVERAAPAVPADHPFVLLGPVTLPQYLDRRELVTRMASNQLRIEDLELWAEPLRDSVPRTLEHDLDTVLGEGRVQRLPWTAAAPPERVVSVDVRRFEKTANHTVELAATWTIADGASGAVRLRRDTKVSLPIATPGTQAAVKVLSDALAALSRAIVAGLREIPREGAPFPVPGAAPAERP
jgi:uncharacterized lipoprotein YmbA